MPLAGGTRVGPYEITALLGAGGMGEVYRAHDDRLDRDVALKMLPAAWFADDAARARLMREARSAAGLNHPHICTIHEVGEAGGRAYIAMELVPGETLSAVLARGSLSLDSTIRYASQLADALAHAHERGIVHRDLKSANIVITPEGRAKILDFGVAKRIAIGEDTQAMTKSGLELTQAGAIVGTLPYIAPEQLRGQPPDTRSDIWAMGVVIYEMAAGNRPFTGQTSFEVMSAILDRPPRPTGGTVPAPLAAVIERCLAKEPDRRYQRAGEVRAALEVLTQPHPGSGAALPARRRRWIVAAAGLGVALAAAGLWRSGLWSSSPPARIQSIAVLPMANLSGDAAQDYFADGMTDALITDLSKIQALKVISRTSTLRYRGTSKPLPEIARELNVEGIIAGSVLRSGDRVRITAQLIEAPADRHVWAENYERDVRDVLALQRDVARAIAGEIRARLTEPEQRRLASARPVNPEAHEAYLRGRAEANKFTEPALRRAITFYEQALSVDRDYALAHAGLADAYATLGGVLGFVSPSEYFPKARAAAEKALELDGTLADAHAVLATVRLKFDWDWNGAAEEFQRVFELNPSLAEAHQEHGTYLEALRRFDEAVAARKRARELDPLSAQRTADVGYPLYYAGRYDEAIEYYRTALEMDQNFFWSHAWIGQARIEQRMFAEAIDEIQQALRISGNNTRVLATLGYAYAVAGQRPKAQQVIAELQARSKGGYVSPYFLAVISAGLGEKEQALAYLDKAVQERQPYLVLVDVEPVFTGVRDDPRFQTLLQRIGLKGTALPAR
jgi:serine/threonine-protein kinase